MMSPNRRPLCRKTVSSKLKRYLREKRHSPFCGSEVICHRHLKTGLLGLGCFVIWLSMALAEEWMHWQGGDVPVLAIDSTDPFEEFSVKIIDEAWGMRPYCFPWKATSEKTLPGVAWLEGDRLLELRAYAQPRLTGEQSLSVVGSLFYRFAEPIGKILSLRVSDLLGMGRPQVHLLMRDERERLKYKMLIQRKEEQSWGLVEHRDRLIGAGVGEIVAFWVHSDKGELKLEIHGKKKKLVLGLREGWRKEVLTEGKGTGIPRASGGLGSWTPNKKSSPVDFGLGWLGDFKGEPLTRDPLIQWSRLDQKGNLEIAVNLSELESETFLVFGTYGESNEESELGRVALNRRRGGRNRVILESQKLLRWKEKRMFLSVMNADGFLFDRKTIGREDKVFVSKSEGGYHLARGLEERWRRNALALGLERSLSYAGPHDEGSDIETPVVDFKKVESWSSFLREIQRAEPGPKWVWDWRSPEPILFLDGDLLFKRREHSLLKAEFISPGREKKLMSTFEIWVKDEAGMALEHHPIELRVLGSKYQWRGLSGNGGRVTPPQELMKDWAEAPLRSPAYLKAQVKGDHLQGALEFGNLGWSDVALSSQGFSRLAGKAHVRLSAGKKLASILLESKGQLKVSSQERVPFGWLENENRRSLLSYTKDGLGRVHADESGRSPSLFSIKRMGFLENLEKGGRSGVELNEWEGEAGFWNKKTLGMRPLRRSPWGLLLQGQRPNWQPLISDSSGVTLYNEKLEALHTWHRPGMEHVDLAPKDDESFWALDRRANRQSWLYELKVVKRRLVVAGVLSEPLDVSEGSRGGGLVWDDRSKVLWVLDRTQGQVLRLDLDGLEMVEKEEMKVPATLLKRLEKDPSPSLHILGQRPWIRLETGFFEVR